MRLRRGKSSAEPRVALKQAASEAGEERKVVLSQERMALAALFGCLWVITNHMVILRISSSQI